MFIYIHLPFCLSHCIYCDFYVELKGTPDRRAAYLAALKQEITEAFSARDDLAPIQTIYLGGGTPGLFTAEEIGGILTQLGQYAPGIEQAEITLEANPDGLASSFSAYRAVGVNRLSMGVQSFQPHELKRLSRVHSKEDAIAAVSAAKAAGFDNISIDLMYGIPEQTQSSWADTLAQVVALDLPHVSLYGLKVEANTRLERLISQGRMATPPDEETVAMYLMACAQLERVGIHRYEISNFARPGFESKHNLAYWDNQEFWGFGVSAHGYIDGVRYENPRDLEAYLAHPSQRAEAHTVSEHEALENAFIFGLRKRQGVFVPNLEQQYGFDFSHTYLPDLARFIEWGLLTYDAGWLTLTLEGVPVSNDILVTFLGVNSTP